MQADRGAHVICRIDIGQGVVTTLAGHARLYGGFADGLGRDAIFSSPQGVAVDAAGTFVLVVSRLRKVSPLMPSLQR